MAGVGVGVGVCAVHWNPQIQGLHFPLPHPREPCRGHWEEHSLSKKESEGWGFVQGH